ncbi:type I restriction enzyme S subunit [Tenacibaculum skagerrakense]|uniref:Type I restriction enzyme S subunit n=1 Tax=Tenacibaculum skagerrakense TaxID=186571 RepID=A0A4R2NUF4_9FLAO|nr:restriction endonuclease subunit S [Tenacibaculum skagerrakense]TCP25144.1 type I restriction enzyme S subunit [Tenacibaculum skagerrakense]
MSYKNRVNFKPLSEFIKRVNIKNKDGKVSELKGINIDKFFMPSVANVVGTDLTRYKVVKPQQFACNRMHVGRDYRLPIAVSKFDKNIIVSPAYDVFEIIDTNKLNPEYLMMWFSRSEFDRNCWFYTDTDVRGKLGWDSFCEIELPIPSIEKQNEIVKEYNIVINRIKLNEQLNQKLEKTAQALYKYWFVDFEFPNKEGKPYKSSDGEMVYNEELDKEIPVGWEVKTFSDVAEISAGGDKPRVFSGFKTKECHVPIFSNGVTEEGLYGFTNVAKILKNSITISARGTIGYTVLRNEPFVPIVRLIVLTPKNENHTSYIFKYIENFDFNSSGSVQKQLTKPDLSVLKILVPKFSLLNLFESQFNSIKKETIKRKQEIELLNEFESIILAKMTKVEVEKEMIN